MAILTAIILWLLFAILVMLCLTLITPVFVRVLLTTSPQLAYRIEMRALAGLAPSLTLAEGQHEGSAPKRTAKPNPKSAKRTRHKMSSFKSGHASAIRALPQLIEGILRCIHLEGLHISADVGLGDPADTGRFCGLFMPLQFASPLPASVSLDLRPDFTKICLNGSVSAAVRVTLAALLVPISRFAWRTYGPQR